VGLQTNASGSNVTTANSITLNLSAALIVGMPTFVVLNSSTVDVHTGPAGWTLVNGGLGEGGYVSLWTRTRVGGDSNTPSWSNVGSHTASFWIAYVGLASSVPSPTWTIPGSATSFNTSSTTITIPATSDSLFELVTQYVFMSCVGNNLVNSANPYPFSLVSGSTAPSIIQRPLRAQGTPTITTLTRTAAVPTVVFSVLLADGGTLGTRGRVVDDEPAWLRSSGYNYYNPATQPAEGGSIQALQG
jgi:hypothetical protein